MPTTKLPKGFKKMTVTNTRLKLLKVAWDLPDDEFDTDAQVWRQVIKDEFAAGTQPRMEHVMRWIEQGP